MTEMHLAFPADFLNRPETREFLAKLSESGCSRIEAEGFAHRIWWEFATARENRRRLREVWNVDPVVATIESYCKWPADRRAALIGAAIMSGFMSYTPDEDTGGWLTLTDFFPLNHHLHRDHVPQQQAAALARGAQRRLRESEEAAAQMEMMMPASARGRLPECSEEERSAALGLIVSLLVVCEKRQPTPAERDELFEAALRVARRYPEKAPRDQVLTWLHGVRQTNPTRLAPPAVILRDWPDYAAQAEKAREVAG